VSIQKIFLNSKRVAGYRQESLSDQESTRAKLEKLAKEIEAEEAALKTLIPGSIDHLTQYRELLQKQADVQIEQDYYKQRMAARELKMTEGLYADILRATAEVAKEKGLDLVFERSEPELPTSGPAQLELAMGTHKLLYCEGCLDISDEVTARIDAR
jgi:Skp family chaperone for outer membrane proteins